MDMWELIEQIELWMDHPGEILPPWNPEWTEAFRVLSGGDRIALWSRVSRRGIQPGMVKRYGPMLRALAPLVLEVFDKNPDTKYRRLSNGYVHWVTVIEDNHDGTAWVQSRPRLDYMAEGSFELITWSEFECADL